VFPWRPEDGGVLQGIWMMNQDGSQARQISFPKLSPGAPREDVGQGDYDPRLSPDGSHVSILRNVGGAFHVVIVNTKTGAETDLTEPLFPERKQTAEGVAAWSSDGKLLVFRHIALPHEGSQGVGIYIMKPDGSGRKRIPIAKGEFPHVQPEFFPEGSDSQTRVIYQTEKDARFSAVDSNATAESAETKYLNFQLMTGLHGYAGPPPMPGHYALGKSQLEEFVQSVVKAIGTTGDARHKLGFTVGPLCFDMSDEETRQFIRESFAVARENDVAVAFHIDDSMNWGQRKDLLSNPDNIETADWKQIPNTGRRADWGPKPTKFPPQMCFNSPEIQAAVKNRAALIGAEIKKEVEALKASGKEHLFAGVIAGWETMIGRDFDTDRFLGYRALSHRGFSESNPPKDPDVERIAVVKEFIELWANSLHTAGIPGEKIYCHIAFTPQGLDHKEKNETTSRFSPPDVAFGAVYRPGFSTYPEAKTFKAIYAALAQHGSPVWISGEGVNVSPTGMPGEATMETYLGRMFNHGAVLTNIFSWGIGGEAMRNNFFRQATENSEALAAYGKFLRGEALVESAATGFSAEAFQDKMHRIQRELPGWVQKSGKQAQAMPLTTKISALIKDRKFQEADKVADEILSLMTDGEKQ
jgi:hypothetical protein